MNSMPANDPGSSCLWTDRLRRFFGITLVSLILVLTAQPTAAKSVGWCRSDPIVAIDGIPADVFVSVPVGALPAISGPTGLVITTPPGVSVVQVASGLGFGYGEEMTFTQSPLLSVTSDGIELKIEVYVPAEGNVPVLLEFAPRGVGLLAPVSAEGTANEWITLRTVL